MSLKYGTEKIPYGKYELIETTSFKKSKCVVKLNGVKVAQYGSVRAAIFHKSDWYEMENA